MFSSALAAHRRGASLCAAAGAAVESAPSASASTELHLLAAALAADSVGVAAEHAASAALAASVVRAAVGTRGWCADASVQQLLERLDDPLSPPPRPLGVVAGGGGTSSGATVPATEPVRHASDARRWGAITPRGWALALVICELAREFGEACTPQTRIAAVRLAMRAVCGGSAVESAALEGGALEGGALEGGRLEGGRLEGGAWSSTVSSSTATAATAAALRRLNLALRLSGARLIPWSILTV